MEGDSRGAVRMDFQGREIAEATVIGGDYRLGKVHFEKFIHGFEEVGFEKVGFEKVGFEEVDFEKFVYGFK